MGMLINGEWHADADRSMIDGTYRREASALTTSLNAEILQALAHDRDRFYLIASASCPWSHGAVIALVLGQLGETIGIQWAGGPRIEGYGLKPQGPLAESLPFQHLHQFYTATDPDYTGRATVPVLWDAKQGKVLSNASEDIIAAFDTAGQGPDLLLPDQCEAIKALTKSIFDGLSNAVYRAGKAERQEEYDDAVDSVFRTMDLLEHRLADQIFLFGDSLTQADIRLFATLVRFDTVYATHFRCTRKRLVDYPNLWRFTRRIYQMPGIAETVDFDEIRYGYYVNDGSHNPHNIIGQQPQIDWYDREGLDA
ncbi:glutathione S-transferase C-terminal domain-containing protein [Gymnodinialimonas sp. 2305UL16-5]|uniref:glutathione S-transferase C-terminal domain-containing protein n=1 Tax=Gymnodinialimonas mytili TaxID=3126503 RepID=UPI0030AB13DE